MNVWLSETYFSWLQGDCFSDPRERATYEGCLRLLHDIPFVWTIWHDENRAGDALAFRQSDFLGFQHDLDTVDQVWLQQWATATPSVLEVLVGVCRRWQYYFEGDIQLYFDHVFKNLGLHRYPGRVLSGRSKTNIRNKIDNWMFRQFEPTGHGSPFPIHASHLTTDMRQVDIWGQMNAYSAEHFQ